MFDHTDTTDAVTGEIISRTSRCTRCGFAFTAKNVGPGLANLAKWETVHTC